MNVESVTSHSLQLVLSHYALADSKVRVEPLTNAAGWSGSLLWRITDLTGHHYCLRRWPSEHPTQERLQFIHHVLVQVVRELPIIAVPIRMKTGKTFIHDGVHFWELTRWLSGIADFHNRPTPGRLRAAMHVLAQFHNLAGDVEAKTGSPPAIGDRLNQLRLVDNAAFRELEECIKAPLGTELDAAAFEMFDALQLRFRRPLPACPIKAAESLHLQPAIRDIHHDHILFIGDRVTGLIDFGALRIDTPLTDVSRLLGSLVADDAQARQTALAAYSDLRPLSDSDCQLVDWLDHTSVIISALNWLRWLHVERREMGPSPPITKRIREITFRLKNQVL